MHIAPCYNCPHRKGCEIKAAKQAAVRGLGLGFTSVRFKCNEKFRDLQPGQRVFLELAGEDGQEDYEGTVMRPHKDRVLVWLDEASPLGKNPLPLHPDRITPNDGERVRVCVFCSQPEGTEAREGLGCSDKCYRCYRFVEGAGETHDPECERCGGTGQQAHRYE